MLRRIVLALLVIGAAAGFVVALNSSETETEPRITDPAVERVFPEPGDLEIRQAPVGVDLDTAFTAVLFIDGAEVPEDQLERTPATGLVQYTPGPEKEFGTIKPGRHCASALLWRFDQTRESGRRYSWCFQVH